MSARRAAIRRERKEREKLQRGKSEQSKMKLYADKGMIDGRAMAACIVLNVLHDQYGFRKKRLTKYLDDCARMSARYTNEVNKFILDFYVDEIEKRMPLEILEEQADVHRSIYLANRDNFFVTALAVQFTILNDHHGFSLNKRDTGRLNTILAYCSQEWIKFQKDPDNHSPDWYFEEMKKKTGLEFS